MDRRWRGEMDLLRGEKFHGDRRRGEIDLFRGVIERLRGVWDLLRGVRERLRGVNDRLCGVIDRLLGVRDLFLGVIERLRGVRDCLRGVTERLWGVTERLCGVTERLCGVIDRLGVNERFWLNGDLDLLGDEWDTNGGLIFCRGDFRLTGDNLSVLILMAVGLGLSGFGEDFFLMWLPLSPKK